MSSAGRLGKSLVLVLSASLLLLAVASGVLAAKGTLISQLMLAGLIGGALMMLLPLPAFFSLIVVVTFLIQGTTSYFLRFQPIAWLPYLLCALALVRVSLRIRQHDDRFRLGGADAWATSVREPAIVCVVLYMITILFAITINTPPISQVVVGLKNALPIWVAALIVLRCGGSSEFRDLFWRLLSIVFFIQVPLVLYQHFIIVPARPDVTTAFDAVVGSFGGLIEAGGANSTLVLFALLVMSYELARFARGSKNFSRLLLFWGTGLVIIFSGEVKAAFLWIPMTVVFVLRKKILSSAVALFATVAVVSVVMMGMFVAYSAMYWSKAPDRASGDMVERMAYFFDPYNVDPQTGEVSRGASIGFWVNDAYTDTPRRLAGYGVGSSRVSTTGGLGEVAVRFVPFKIAATGIAMLLWDAGLIGLFAFVGIVVFGLIASIKAARSPGISPIEAARLDALSVYFLIALTLLFYNTSLLEDPSTQLLLAIAVGYVCATRSRLRADR